MSILVEVCVWLGQECWEGWEVAFDFPPMAGDEIFLPDEISQWCKADLARIDSRTWSEDGSISSVHADAVTDNSTLAIEKRTGKSATQSATQTPETGRNDTNAHQ